MSTPHRQFVAVLDGQRCRGHVLSRGKSGFEAFDGADVSIGLLPTQREAAAALSLARPRPGRATIITRLVSGTALPIADVKVGSRHRRDLGDIAALARNIEELGLLHPIVLRPDGTLVAGERRLAAFKYLGRDTIPVTVIDLEKVAVGAYAENTFRKAFTPSELADIADAIEPLERVAAKERQREHGGTAPGKHSGEIPASDKGRALDKVAKIVGKDRKTIQKARAVRDAASADPKTFGKLQEDMDRTGRVNGVFRRLKVLKQAKELRKEIPPLPSKGPYRVIVVDPSWRYEKRADDPSHRGTTPYPPMSVEEICAVKVADLAHADCVLWLWTTNAHLLSGDALAVLKAWNFTPKAMLTWDKGGMGTGEWLRGQTEHCIMAVRGRPTVELTNQTTLLAAPAREHSRKPDEFYSLVESLCPAPRYASLFHRGPTRPKWVGHGDEVAVPQGAAA